MKYESLNIYSTKKILFDTILKKNNYLKNYNINYNYFEKTKDIKISIKNLNIIFLPPMLSKNECNNLKQILKKTKITNSVLCIDKKIGSIFSKLGAHILFLPVSFQELEKQVNFMRISMIIGYKNLQLNRHNNELINSISKKSVRLTNIESNILYILMKESRPIAKNEINKNALGYLETIESHSLDSHIYRLRKKIKTVSTKISIIAKVNSKYQIN